MRAAESYESVHHRLVKFSNGAAAATRWPAPIAMDQVARRLSDGAGLTAADPYLFFHGVAVNVLRGTLAVAQRAQPSLDDLPASLGHDDPRAAEDRAAGRGDARTAPDLFDSCLSALPPESRELVAQYHLDLDGRKMDVRRALAASLGIPLNALRIRVFRLRQSLERCVASCMGRAGAA